MLGFLTPVLAADTSSGSSGLAVLFPLLLMGVIFYFLLIRPQRRQRQAHQRLVDSVDVGDEVVTIGGVYGTVRALDDESLTVEIAPNVQVRFSRGAIARKLVYDDEYEDADEDGGDDQDPDDEDGDDANDESAPQASRTGPWFGSRRRGRTEEADDKP